MISAFSGWEKQVKIGLSHQTAIANLQFSDVFYSQSKTSTFSSCSMQTCGFNFWKMKWIKLRSSCLSYCIAEVKVVGSVSMDLLALLLNSPDLIPGQNHMSTCKCALESYVKTKSKLNAPSILRCKFFPNLSVDSI